jgi:hypothetical protein
LRKDNIADENVNEHHLTSQAEMLRNSYANVVSENEGPQIKASELSQVLEKSLKNFLLLQQNTMPGLKQTITLEAPNFKFNLVSDGVHSVQIITEPTKYVLDSQVDHEHGRQLQKDRNISNLLPPGESNEIFSGKISADHNSFTFSSQPIQNVYFRKRKKNLNQGQGDHNVEMKVVQDNVNPNPSSLNRGKTTKLKIRSLSSMNGQESVQTLRRSTRINKKMNGCKNRSILKSEGEKSTRASKKRRIASPEELRDKLILPAANPNVDFPSLTDLENSDPFPEISINSIQDLATSRCGISPLEVSSELLLATNPNCDSATLWPSRQAKKTTVDNE